MKLFTQNDTLVIEMQGFEIFWALKKRFTISFANISSLEFHEIWEWPKENPKLIRVGGTFAPKVLMAGHYRAEGAQYFAYLKGVQGSGFGAIKTQNVAVITTQDYPIVQIFVSVNSSDDIPKL